MILEGDIVEDANMEGMGINSVDGAVVKSVDGEGCDAEVTVVESIDSISGKMSLTSMLVVSICCAHFLTPT